jgi:hypothetical protein
LTNSHPPLMDEQERAPLPALVPSALPTSGETASAATAMQARASIESRYLMALQRPRSVAAVRQKVLEACKRPRFAEKARYAVPRGGSKVVGFTIRFAEELARCLTNVLCESMVVYDDDEQRIVRCSVTDLEANVTYPLDVVVRKTVERNTVRPGQVVVGERTGSNGQRVFIVAATDDDLQNKQASLVSKALRTGLLRVCPADILEEAEEQVIRTVRTEDAKDPAAAAKRISDAFYALGVDAMEIEKLLGHSVSRITTAEVQLLRELYTAMKEEGASWKDLATTFGAKSADAETRVGVAAIKQALAKKGADVPVTRERQPGEDENEEFKS